MTLTGYHAEGYFPRLFLTLLCIFLTTGCPGGEEELLPPERTSVNGAPEIRDGPAAGARTLRLRVLTYNVQGLPWPLRLDSERSMEQIGRELRRMRGNGTAPHIVFLQEAFTDAAEQLIDLAGYSYSARGPAATDPPPPASQYISDEFRKERRLIDGEGWGKWADSGLYILSDYPILEQSARPFSRDACAGWDCLANKGVLFARIELPGLPVPLQVFTAHLNSRIDAGVPERRSLTAHRAQVRELDAFIERRVDPALPLIFGGDFNTMDAPARFDYLERQLEYPILRKFCVKEPGCPVDLRLDGKAPWLKTQDLQGFQPGRGVRIRPVQAGLVFEKASHRVRLSDHDGYLVTYELRWHRNDAFVDSASILPAPKSTGSKHHK